MKKKSFQNSTGHLQINVMHQHHVFDTTFLKCKGFVCLFVCFFLFNPPCPPKLLPLLKAQSCPLLRISKMNILLLYLNTLHRSISVADKIGITGLSKMWGSATG